MPFDPDFVQNLRVSKERLLDLLNNFTQARVLVIGDLTLDEYLTGKVESISSEAPVLILRHKNTVRLPGSGANLAYKLAQLGAQVKAVGLVGKDEEGKALRNLLKAANINIDGIFCDTSRVTVTRTRVLAYSQPSQKQQIVTIDQKSDEFPQPNSQLDLAEYIKQHMTSADILLCCDRSDGTLTRPVISSAVSATQTVVNTQKHLERYRGAKAFVLNLREAELSVGYTIDDEKKLSEAGKDLLVLTQAQHILITGGADGMILFDRNGTKQHIPNFHRNEILDITDTQDTLTTLFSLGLATGASSWEAAILANLASGLANRQLGTKTATNAKMKIALEAFLKDKSFFN